MEHLLDWMKDAATWLLLAIISTLAWFIRSDWQANKETLRDHGVRLSAIETNHSSRPEVLAAIESTEHRMAEDISQLRDDVTHKLDLVIRLVRGRPD